MLRELIIVTAFLFALSGIAASVVIVQKSAAQQEAKVNCIMEMANEID